MLRSPSAILPAQPYPVATDCCKYQNGKGGHDLSKMLNPDNALEITDCFPQRMPPEFFENVPRDPMVIYPPSQSPFPDYQPTQPGVIMGPIEIFYPSEVRIGMVGEALTGGIVGGITHQNMAAAIDGLRQNGFSLGGLKTLGSASLKAGAIGAGISAAASTLQNISARSKGLITTRDAVSNISTDSVGGLMAGASAGVAAGAGTLALRSFGLAGLPLTIGAAAAGALGGVAGNRIFDASGLRDRIFRGVREMLS